MGDNSVENRWIDVDGTAADFDIRVRQKPRRVTLDPSAEVFKWFHEADVPLDCKTVTQQLEARP